jgi:hypothetical protein
VSELVRTSFPSFPEVKLDQLFSKLKINCRWQVLCGDQKHFRIGVYSPEFHSVKQLTRFEKHSCPEFFLLLQGQVSVAILTGKGKKIKIKVIKLQPLQGILVKGWHTGFCPNGKFTGKALVVERDHFTTWYRTIPCASMNF